MFSAHKTPAASIPPVAPARSNDGAAAERQESSPSPVAECPPDLTAHPGRNPAPPRPETVLCHGCFDMLHAGHIEHLREAKKLGTRLVVSITADAFVKRGAWRPYYSEDQRAAHLRALRFVDEVVICQGATAVPVIDQIKPFWYVKGIDYDPTRPDPALIEEMEAVRRHGGDFLATQAPKGSSSRLLARIQHGDLVGDYLDTCRARGFLARIEAAWERAQKLAVAFIGETIVDEYRYVSALGKPSKEFVLAVAEESREIFAGGVVAAAKHAQHLCQVTLVTQPLATTLTKTRYVDRDFARKVFEVYSRPGLALDEDARKRFTAAVKQAARESDAVVVFDFGHGLIDAEARRQLRNHAKFLAVNAQSNAGNQGYNPVTLYDSIGPDYVCVDLPEARLAIGAQHADPAAAHQALALKMGEPHVIITNGREGAWWTGGRVPAFTTQPRDTIGAGDAFLAVTAPLVAAGLGLEEAALVGNVAGALKTEILGHRSAIDAETLRHSVRSLLK